MGLNENELPITKTVFTVHNDGKKINGARATIPLTITWEGGLHMRPSAELAKLAGSVAGRARILLTLGDDEPVDTISIMNLMMLVWERGWVATITVQKEWDPDYNELMNLVGDVEKWLIAIPA